MASTEPAPPLAPPKTDAEPSTSDLSISDLSPSDLEVAGIKPRRRQWVPWLLLLVLVLGGGGWGGYHLFAVQQSTAQALHRGKASHRETRVELYETRNQAAAAERRAERAEERGRTERERFEEEETRLRTALGPELADAEALTTALGAISEGLEVVRGTNRLTLRLAAASLFAAEDAVLSEDGAALLSGIGAALHGANVDLAVQTRPTGDPIVREVASARALAIIAFLEGETGGMDTARLSAVVQPPSDDEAVGATIELVIRPRG